MGWGWKAGLARLCVGVWLGTWMVACGPVLEEPRSGDAIAVPSGSGSTAAEPWAFRLDLDDYTPAPLARYGPSVAYGGGKYLVVWHDMRTGTVYGTRVKKDGTVLDPEGIRINPGSAAGGTPAVAYNGTHFFVVWESGDGIDGVRVTTEGTVLGPVFELIQSGESFSPVAIACSEDVCLTTFVVTGDEELVIYYRRVSSDGVVLPPGARPLSPGGTNLASEPSVAWNNSREEFLVVWSDQRGGAGSEDIYGGRVAEDGTLLDGRAGFPISTAPGAQRRPDVTWSGRRFHVVWTDTRDGDADIYGARVRPNGTVEDPAGIPISTAPGAQTSPRVAHHNSKSLVVWDDTRNGPSRIWGARLGEDGDVWDASGFPISQGDQPQEFLPDVAYGGDRFFTGYGGGAEPDKLEPHFILGTRVNHQGQVKDSPALPLTLEPR
jgi:hypothetical protein